jgi:hypothetical protein
VHRFDPGRGHATIPNNPRGATVHKKPTNYRPAFVATLVAGLLALIAVALFGSATASAAPTGPDTQLVAATPTTSTPIGVQPDGRIAGCVKSTAGSAPAPLFMRRTTGTCGTGFKTVYWAQKGVRGQVGPRGLTGPAGPKGEAGAPAAEPTYAVGKVFVSRGGADATEWAAAGTSVAGPFTSTASTTFRMTCSAAKAPCLVSVKARATGDVLMYPRLLITREDIDTGAPKGTCEYGDGADNDGGSSNVGVGTEKTYGLGIGGTLDCGTDQVRPANGVVQEIKVPAGYYNIAATFGFSRTISVN